MLQFAIQALGLLAEVLLGELTVARGSTPRPSLLLAVFECLEAKVLLDLFFVHLWSLDSQVLDHLGRLAVAQRVLS